MIRAVLLLSSLLFVSPSFSAGLAHYVISADRTTIALSWVMLGDRPSRAHLSQVTGDVFLDPQRKNDDRVDVKIPISTLEASNALLTHQMKSGMFFDASRYPWVIFTSQRVTGLANGHFKIFGALTIKNIQRPVVLDAVLDRPGTDLPNREQLFLHAHTAISRSAFTLDRWLLLVGDTINIDIDIAAMPNALK